LLRGDSIQQRRGAVVVALNCRDIGDDQRERIDMVRPNRSLINIHSVNVNRRNWMRHLSPPLAKLSWRE
jgi:hypothetical protein